MVMVFMRCFMTNLDIKASLPQLVHFHLKTEITRHTFIPCMCVALIIYTNK